MHPENANRAKISMLVSFAPGLHMRALQRLLGTSFNTVRHHVSVMARMGEIACERDGRFVRLFPKGSLPDSRVMYSVLSNRISRTLARALAERVLLSNKQLCEATGLSKSSVSEHIQRLVQAGIVRKLICRDGRPAYRLTDMETVIDAIEGVRSSPFRMAVSNYLDLWDL